jgi:xanthine dehydrogenase small subunit
VQAAAAALARDFTPIGDARASRDYRMKVGANLLLRFYHESAGATETRVRAYG